MALPVKFSIIILSYNRARQLRNVLASVTAQTYPADEVIIIDGGSTDGTKDLVKEFDGVQFQVVRERDETGVFTGSLAHSANVGARLARNSWIYFLSDDAVMDRKCLEVMAQEIVRSPTYGAYASKFNLYDSRNTHGHRFHDDLLLFNFGAVDKRILEKIGGFDEGYKFYSWNIDFSYHLWIHGYKIFKSDSLVFHHWHENEGGDPYQDEARFYEKVQKYRAEHKEISRWAELMKSFTLYRTSKILGPVIEELISQTPKGGHIAEIGFGSGMTAILLADLGYRVTALDIDPDVIDLLKYKIGYISNLYVQKQDMFNLDNFDDDYFDVMYHQGVLEHFSDNEIIDTLKQQGRIARKIVFDVPNDKRKEKFQLYGNERFLPLHHWMSLIEKAGLQVEKICGRRFGPYAQWLPARLLSRDGWLARWKGESNTYVCKKPG